MWVIPLLARFIHPKWLAGFLPSIYQTHLFFSSTKGNPFNSGPLYSSNMYCNDTMVVLNQEMSSVFFSLSNRIYPFFNVGMGKFNEKQLEV